MTPFFKRPQAFQVGTILVALLIQMFLIFHLTNSLTLTSVGDPREYWGIALNISQKGIYSFDGQSPTAIRQPLYPLFLSLFVTRGPHPVQMIQAIINLMTLVNFFLMAKMMYGEKIGRIALGLLSLYVPFLATSVWIMTECIYLFFASIYWVGIAFILKRKKGSPSVLVLLVAVSFGLMFLVRSSALFLSPLFLAILAGENMRGFLKRLFLILAGVGLVVAPWSIYKINNFNTLSPTSTEYGLDLSYAAQPDGIHAFLHGGDPEFWSGVRTITAGKYYSDPSVSEKLREKAIAEIRANPATYLKNTVLRIALLSTILPGFTGLRYFYPFLSKFSAPIRPVIVALGFSGGIVLLLGAIWGFSKVPDKREAFFLFVLPALGNYLGYGLLSNGNQRYALACIFSLIILFSIGLNVLLSRWSLRQKSNKGCPAVHFSIPLTLLA